MKIVLVNPPFIFPLRKDRILSHCLGLRYLSSYLKQRGHEVTFVDALKNGFDTIRRFGSSIVTGLSPEDIVGRIPADTELIGISVPFSQLAPIAHELVIQIREKYPKIQIVTGDFIISE